MAKRFYEAVTLAEQDDGFIVKLDAHVLKTPAKSALVLPTKALAQLVADDWQAQGEEVDTLSMLHMRLVSTALDRVAGVMPETRTAFAAYGMSDLLCYRAEAPDPLIAKQAQGWDPILAWAKTQFGIVLQVTHSVLPIEQPAQTEEILKQVAGEDAFRLTGLAHTAALLGSGVLALALEQGEISPEQAYELAFLDDLFQIETWGRDEEAQVRLDNIALEIKAIARYLSALQQ